MHGTAQDVRMTDMGVVMSLVRSTLAFFARNGLSSLLFVRFILRLLFFDDMIG